MIIYLAGSIPKGDAATAEFFDWHSEYQKVLKALFDADCIVPLAGEVPERDSLLVVGKDSSSIKRSDLVVVNAEKKIGAGTAMEMVIAKYFKKPVVSVIPKDTHHRRSNLVFEGEVLKEWINPFVATFSDLVIENIAQIVDHKDNLANLEIKDISIIDKAVAYRDSYKPQA